MTNNQQAFLELVRAGLWEKEARLLPFGEVDYDEIMRLAEMQSVDGLVTEGIEHIQDVKAPQDVLLQFIGSALQLEQANIAMNEFLVKLVKKLRKTDVYALLVKGQGVAQCYEKPFWRASGDIDLLLDEKNYKKAEKLLAPLAEEDHGEEPVKMHHALIINGFDIELHGKMPFLMSKRVDRVIDEAIANALKMGGVRVWSLDDTDIYLPNPDNDVIIVWTHMLHHFFIEGVGLRQICDWCRLLWKFKNSLNRGLLEKRIRKAGLMTEWQVFGTLAVEYLGMPTEAMPFYKDSKGTRRKAKRVLARVMKSGNFGHNNDLSYRAKYTGFTYRLVALWRRLVDFIGLSQVFPLDAPKFFVTYVFGKV